MLGSGVGGPAIFDCRVWQVPNLEVAAQNLLWRELDAYRNSVSAVAIQEFSHRELQGVNTKGKIKMLGEKYILFENLPTRVKRGAYFVKRKVLRELDIVELQNIP